MALGQLSGSPRLFPFVKWHMYSYPLNISQVWHIDYVFVHQDGTSVALNLSKLFPSLQSGRIYSWATNIVLDSKKPERASLLLETLARRYRAVFPGIQLSEIRCYEVKTSGERRLLRQWS